MALHMNPVFTLDLVRKVDSTLDNKLRDLDRMTESKNNTDTTNSTNTKNGEEFNIEDLKNLDPSMFDPSKMNLDPANMEEMQKKVEELTK